jgi:hypothetical protein
VVVVFDRVTHRVIDVVFNVSTDAPFTVEPITVE